MNVVTFILGDVPEESRYQSVHSEGAAGVE